MNDQDQVQNGSEHMDNLSNEDLNDILITLNVALSDAIAEEQKQRIRKWITYFSRLIGK